MSKITLKINNDYIRKGRKLPARAELSAWDRGRLIGIAITGPKGERPEVTPRTTAQWLLQSYHIEEDEQKLELLEGMVKKTVEEGRSIVHFLADAKMKELLERWRGKIIDLKPGDGLRPPGWDRPPRARWWTLKDTESLFRREP